MNLIELNRSLVQLRLSGMAAVMETRLLQAQSENMAPIDLISTLVSDELGPVHTKRSASTIRAKFTKARKSTSSFSKREKIRRKPFNRRNSRSISLRFL